MEQRQALRKDLTERASAVLCARETVPDSVLDELLNDLDMYLYKYGCSPDDEWTAEDMEIEEYARCFAGTL